MTVIPLVLYEGDSPNIDECEWLMEAAIVDLPPDRPRGKPVRVTLKYDNSGILRGMSEDVETGKQTPIVINRDKASAQS
jgi:molecular chaperone DnaK (HSP70)